jgi:hypothetical protein
MDMDAILTPFAIVLGGSLSPPPPPHPTHTNTLICFCIVLKAIHIDCGHNCSYIFPPLTMIAFSLIFFNNFMRCWKKQ